MAGLGQPAAQRRGAAVRGGPPAWGNPAIGARIGIDAISEFGPALAAHDGQLVLAWRGVDNGAVNVAFWQPGTPGFEGLLTFGEVTIAEPALVSHDGRLLLAWTGSDKRINVAELPAGGTALTGKVTLPDTSDDGPALASFSQRLFIALQQEDNNDLIIMASDDGGRTFAGRPRTPQTSTLTTALAAGQQYMFWAWTGVGNELLNVGRYAPPPGRLPVTPFGAARNRTETTTAAQITGTDLGNQFMHGERMCFLFGDTAHVRTDEEQDKGDGGPYFNLDTIAFADVSDFDPDTGLALTFNPTPPIIAGMQNSQTVYSVPLDGITIDGTMFLFYSLDHIEVAPGYDSFGRTACPGPRRRRRRQSPVRRVHHRRQQCRRPSLVQSGTRARAGPPVRSGSHCGGSRSARSLPGGRQRRAQETRGSGAHRRFRRRASYAPRLDAWPSCGAPASRLTAHRRRSGH